MITLLYIILGIVFLGVLLALTLLLREFYIKRELKQIRRYYLFLHSS